MLSFENKPIIGMVHLGALPGSPQSGGGLSAITDAAVADAERLLQGGVDALMMENFGDTPFFPGRVPSITVACMSRVAAEIKRRFDCHLGINVLRNDGESALSVAVAASADFIRVNVLCGARVTDQGLVEGIAHSLLRRRAELSAKHIQILADIDVKHSAPVAQRPVAEEVSDTIQRGGADALIVSGTGTGQQVDQAQLQAVKQAAGSFPVLIGSGITGENISAVINDADGFIVGSSLKTDGIPTNPVDTSRVEALVSSVRGRTVG